MATVLDGLAQESKYDPSLLRELAAAHGKLADVQESAFDVNVGDATGALQNCRTAIELLEVLCLAQTFRIARLAASWRKAN